MLVVEGSWYRSNEKISEMNLTTIFESMDSMGISSMVKYSLYLSWSNYALFYRNRLNSSTFSFSDCMGFTSADLLYKIKSIFIHEANQYTSARTSISPTYSPFSSTGSNAHKTTVSLCSSLVFPSTPALTSIYRHLVILFAVAITLAISLGYFYSLCHQISIEPPSMSTISSSKCPSNSSSISI